MTHVVCTSTHDINPSGGSFYVPIPKEMGSCKELAEILSSHKQITSPLLPKSKAFVVANLTIKKEFKLVNQVGEENNGGNSDQDGISDVAMEHTKDEFEE
jgi:hypothetical protein